MSDSAAVSPGHLYVVATPIGNLGDLSPRALKVLDGVDLIAAEDTRVTGALLAHFGVRKKQLALHEHNEEEAAREVLEALAKGRSVALVSDAGTPLVSDPGYTLVRDARAAGMPVIAVPGPSAAIAALSISGLPSDSFLFAGFLPAKPEQRKRRLGALASEPRTVILYESSHRIAETLEAMAEVLGAARRVCLARELTKLHEQAVTLPLAELRRWFAADENHGRGEFVLVMEGAPAEEHELAEARRVLSLLLPEMGASRAAKIAAEITHRARRELYDLAVELKGGDAPKDAAE